MADQFLQTLSDLTSSHLPDLDMGRDSPVTNCGIHSYTVYHHRPTPVCSFGICGVWNLRCSMPISATQGCTCGSTAVVYKQQRCVLPRSSTRKYLHQRIVSPVRWMAHKEYIAPCPSPLALLRRLILLLNFRSRPLLFFDAFHDLCCKLRQNIPTG